MSIAPYRQALSRRGVRGLLTLSLLARMPIVSAPIVLALHVVIDMDRGFAQSGLIASLVAVGGGIGSPLLGRAIDRNGLRPVVAACAVAQTSFWMVAAWLPFPALLAGALFGGLVAIPIFSINRSAMAALLPPRDRQAGFALDAMLVEISFAVGPALFIVMLTQLGSSITLPAIAMLIMLSGAAIWLINPPMRDEHGAAAAHETATTGPGGDGARTPLRQVWTSTMTAVLVISGTATVILAGTDVALTATMRHFDEVPLIGLVFATWCIASLVGGFVYGMSRPRPPSLLLVLMAGLCIPAILATNWWTLSLLLIPTGLFCAPVMSTTSQALSILAPPAVRVQVMGLQGSALIFGNAVGAPFAGVVVDQADPRLGFLAIGLLGVAVTLALMPITRRIPLSAEAPADLADPAVGSVGSAGDAIADDALASTVTAGTAAAAPRTSGSASR